MKEAVIQKLARLYLKSLGRCIPIAHWRIPVEQRWMNGQLIKNELRGFPDLLICYRGIFIGAECKMEGKKQSDKQKLMEEIIVNAKGFYFVFSSLNGLVESLQEIALQNLKSLTATQDHESMLSVLKNLESKPQIRRILDLKQKADVEPESDNAKVSRPPF